METCSKGHLRFCQYADDDLVMPRVRAPKRRMRDRRNRGIVTTGEWQVVAHACRVTLRYVTTRVKSLIQAIDVSNVSNALLKIIIT